MLILEKVGGGPGGEAAWIAEAMLRAVGELAPLRRGKSKLGKGDLEASSVEWVQIIQNWAMC